MDSNKLYEKLNPVQKTVFNRLYQLSIDKNKKKTEEPAKPKVRRVRSNIELDLICRHQKTQAKLHSMRLEQAEKDTPSGVPTIDPMSRQMANTCLLYTSDAADE